MQTTTPAVSGGTAESLSKSPYRPEIDGLRAFAVVAVIINHFNKDLLPSGYLGVDIFFVISGYVITSSLANHRSETFGDFFLGFYARRVKRLVPALVVFVVGTFIVASLFIPKEPVFEYNLYLRTRETLENPAHLRDNSPVITGMDWVDGRQAAWLW